MPKIEQKQVVITEIKEKLDKSLSLVMVDARGLTVEQDTILRKKLREAGIDYKVYKNTMVEFAIEGTQYSGIKEYLKGPSAFAFSYQDPTTAASIIASQLKTMPKLEFKAGVVDGVCYDADGITAISQIPSKEVLLSKLLGSFKSPMSGFARLVNAIAEKKASGDTSTTESVKEETVETPEAEAPATPTVAEEAPAVETHVVDTTQTSEAE